MAKERVERRLAAILAADVAGYSRLMEADEEGTHERLKAHFRQLIEPKIQEERGRIIKNTGDGLLAEFPSVVDAVRCAAEIQRLMIDRNADTSEDKCISFRIGVNLGDVIVEPGDIFGDGVNIAARLEALAEPGGICISRVVRDQIRDKLSYPFEDMGEQSVKNISRPVRVFALSAVAVASLPAVSVAAADRTPAAASDPIFYDLPDFPDRYQAREEDVASVRLKLLGDRAAIRVSNTVRAIGLHGMGGIGKTVLALALVHDPDVRAAFPDGVVWLTFGREVPVLAKATEFLYVLTRERTSFRTISEARGELGLHTAGKRLLVVLDDVWERATVDPFMGLGDGCRVLITARDIRVLERARADSHYLDLLKPMSARGFLAEATDMAIEALPVEADQIIRECGRLPLALAAIGALIRRGTFD